MHQLSDVRGVSLTMVDGTLIGYMNQWVEDRNMWDVYRANATAYDEPQHFEAGDGSKNTGAPFETALNRLMSLTPVESLIHEVQLRPSADRV